MRSFILILIGLGMGIGELPCTFGAFLQMRGRRSSAAKSLKLRSEERRYGWRNWKRNSMASEAVWTTLG